MIWGFTAVCIAALLWILANFVPAALHAPSGLLSAVSGLAGMIGHVNYFVPVGSILGAVGFVVVVYNFRLALVLLSWLKSVIPWL